VSKSSKHHQFHFSLGVLFRWLLFALVIYFSINYLSTNKSHFNTNLDTQTLNNVLGTNTQPLVNEATKSFEYYKKEALNFINNQIIDLKKQAVTKVYEDLIHNIENPQK